MKDATSGKMAAATQLVVSPSDGKQQSLMQKSNPSTVSISARVDNLPPEILIKIFIQVAINSGNWDEVISFAMATRNTYACFREHYPHVLTKAAMRYMPCGPGMPELVVKSGIAEMTRRWRFASFTEDFMKEVYSSPVRDLLKPWMCRDLLAWLRDGEEVRPVFWHFDQSVKLRCPEFIKAVPIRQRAEVYKVYLDCEMFNHGVLQKDDGASPCEEALVGATKTVQGLNMRLKEILGDIQDFPMPIATISHDWSHDWCLGIPLVKIHRTEVSSFPLAACCPVPCGANLVIHVLICFAQLDSQVAAMHRKAHPDEVFSGYSDLKGYTEQDDSPDEVSGFDQDNSNITDNDTIPNNDTIEDHYWVEDRPSHYWHVQVGDWVWVRDNLGVSLRPNHIFVSVCKRLSFYTVVIKDNYGSVEFETLEADEIRGSALLEDFDVDAAFVEDVMVFMDMCRLEILGEEGFDHRTILVGPAGVRDLGYHVAI
jgi:hypothetical protein